jgi:outer membrane protein OmpA-like peptidoglycan-associated protein
MRISKVLVSSIVLSIIITGCTSTMPQVMQGEKTQKGAAIGAVTGAILGTVTGKGNKAKRAAAGAAIGSVIGGVIGYNMDKQAKEIAQVLDTNVDNSPDAEVNSDKGIIVTKNDRYVKITFREAMMFPTNSSQLTGSAKYKVRKMIGVLRNYPSTIIQVVGHTDNRGSHSYNQRLSEKRALSVANMIKNSGIPNRVYRKGCSFDKPVVPNTDEKNMALNRRVEIFLYPNENFVVNQCI